MAESLPQQLAGILSLLVLAIKKTFGYKNRCEKKRLQFRQQLAQKEGKKIIYLDECGIRKNETCQYGWAHRSSRLYGLKEGSQHKALNIIGALYQNKLLAPFLFEGTCDSTVFNVYVENILQPHLNANTVVVLDNASFHKPSKIDDIAKNKGAKVLYLPTYSPDLNPIEHHWHGVKTKIRTILRNNELSLQDSVYVVVFLP